MNKLKPIILEKEKIRLIITGTFDLGYFLKSEKGDSYQLRVPEMKGDALSHHLDGTDNEMIGIEIEAFDSVTFPGRVSQLTQDEIFEKVNEFNKKIPIK